MTFTEQQIAKALDGHFYHMDHTRGEPAVIDLNSYKKDPPRIRIRAKKPEWFFEAPVGRKPTMAEILIVVEHFYGVGLKYLKSNSKGHKTVRAKHVAFYLGRHLANLSYPKIGRFMGGRDHTTALNGVKLVEENRQHYQPELSRCIAALEGGRVEKR